MYSKKGIRLNNYEFRIRLNGLGFDLIDDYINSKTSIRFKCSDCNKIFKRRPKEISSIKCSCKDKNIDYISNAEKKGFNVLEKYKNIRYKILHQCKKCGLKFKTTPKSILNSVNGCPSCSGKKFSTEYYVSKLPKDIEFLSVEYKGSIYYHLHKCKICNFEWETKPNYILHMKTSCPSCASSKGEKTISKILEELNLIYKKEYSINIDGVNYRFDFFIPELNLIIEYDGKQHFEPIEYFGGDEAYQKIKNNDLIKNNWCLDNSILLLRIPYNQNIEELIFNLFKVMSENNSLQNK
jgi:very-short-patch-repair endonuclease